MEITATIKRAGNAVASISRPSNVTTSVTRIGGSGTSDYEELENKPSINGVELVGDKSTADLLIDVGVTSVNGNTGDVTLNIPTVPTDVSAFNNDAQYVNASQAAAAAPVQSVNGSTGAVTVSVPTKVSQLSNDSGFITGINSGDVTTALGYTPYNATNPNGYVNASGAASAAPVQSVNGQTGTVTLSIPTVPTDVSAFNNDAHYLHGNTKGVFYGVSTTTASTAEKAVTCAEFTSADKVAGAVVFVIIGHTNTASVDDVKLNVNSTGAKAIRIMENGALAKLPSADYLQTAMVYPFYFDGDYWVCLQNHTPKNVSELNNDSGFVTASTAPVTSVNGATGAVTLTIPTVPTDVSSFNNDVGYLTLSTLPVYSGGVSP